MKRTMYAIAYFVNPAWGQRSERNQLEYKELKMFTSSAAAGKYITKLGFDPVVKDGIIAGYRGGHDSQALEIRRRAV